MAWIVVGEPTDEPVDLPTVKAHLHLNPDDTDQDTLLAGYIAAARQLAEARTNRAIARQILRWATDRWPVRRIISLPRPPLLEVSALYYYDPTGEAVSVPSDLYVVDTTSEPGRIVPVWGQFWPPVTLQPIAAVQVEYVAGWLSPELVPAALKQALLLLVGHWHENREAVTVNASGSEVPLAVRSLLDAYWVPPPENA